MADTRISHAIQPQQFTMRGFLGELSEVTTLSTNFQRTQDAFKKDQTDKAKDLSKKVCSAIESQGKKNLGFSIFGIAGAAICTLIGPEAQAIGSAISTNANFVGQGWSYYDRARETTHNHHYQRETEGLQSLSKAKNQWDQFWEQFCQSVSRLQQLQSESYRSASGK